MFLYSFLLYITCINHYNHSSIDATFEESFGRFVNDSPPATANSVIKRKVINGVSKLLIYANKDIDAGTEIT